MTVTINGTTGIAGVDGSAATPAVQGADTNTGMFFPAADTIAFANGGAEAMRIDSGGDVGIGTTTPAEPLSVVGQVSVSGASGGFLMRSRNTNASSSQWYSPTVGNTRLFDTVAAADRVIIDSSGNLSFNSGYGSAAVAYGCRAWVNFNGTGTVAIRASGNVSSITDNGVGSYTVNFTTAMPDINYSTVFGGAVSWNQTNADQGWTNLRSNNGGPSPQQTGSVSVWSSSKSSSIGVAVDNEQTNIAIFR